MPRYHLDHWTREAQMSQERALARRATPRRRFRTLERLAAFGLFLVAASLLVLALGLAGQLH